MSDILTDKDREEIEYARRQVRQARHLGSVPSLTYVLLDKQAQLIEQMQEQLECLRAKIVEPSPKTAAFLIKLFEQVDGVAQSIQAAGGECRFEMDSHVIGNEVVIVLKPAAEQAPKESASPDDALLARIRNDFTFHPASPDQAHRYDQLRSAAKGLALNMVALCPRSRELSMALTNLEQAGFWANAAIARNS